MKVAVRVRTAVLEVEAVYRPVLTPDPTAEPPATGARLRVETDCETVVAADPIAETPALETVTLIVVTVAVGVAWL